MSRGRRIYLPQLLCFCLAGLLPFQDLLCFALCFFAPAILCCLLMLRGFKCSLLLLKGEFCFYCMKAKRCEIPAVMSETAQRMCTATSCLHTHTHTHTHTLARAHIHIHIHTTEETDPITPKQEQHAGLPDRSSADWSYAVFSSPEWHSFSDPQGAHTLRTYVWRTCQTKKLLVEAATTLSAAVVLHGPKGHCTYALNSLVVHN